MRGLLTVYAWKLGISDHRHVREPVHAAGPAHCEFTPPFPRNFFFPSSENKELFQFDYAKLDKDVTASNNDAVAATDTAKTVRFPLFLSFSLSFTWTSFVDRKSLEKLALPVKTLRAFQSFFECSTNSSMPE